MCTDGSEPSGRHMKERPFVTSKFRQRVKYDLGTSFFTDPGVTILPLSPMGNLLNAATMEGASYPTDLPPLPRLANEEQVNKHEKKFNRSTLPMEVVTIDKEEPVKTNVEDSATTGKETENETGKEMVNLPPIETLFASCRNFQFVRPRTNCTPISRVHPTLYQNRYSPISTAHWNLK